MTIKPLLFIPSPRDIPEFIKATSKLKVDKLWLKYYPQEYAYVLGRHWFLEHQQYTHFVILPDDLIVTQKNLDSLSMWASTAYYPVISGWCNNTAGPTDYVYSNISLTLPPDPPQSGTFDGYNFLCIRDINLMPKEIIKVKYSGFALEFMTRDVVERIPFRSDYGCCIDSCLAFDLDHHNITQYVDLNNVMRHVRSKPLDIMVGRIEKRLVFESV